MFLSQFHQWRQQLRTGSHCTNLPSAIYFTPSPRRPTIINKIIRCRIKGHVIQSQCFAFPRLNFCFPKAWTKPAFFFPGFLFGQTWNIVIILGSDVHTYVRPMLSYCSIQALAKIWRRWAKSDTGFALLSLPTWVMAVNI